MRKRLCAMLLALTMVVTTLAGCSSANTSKETVKSSDETESSGKSETTDMPEIDWSGFNPSGNDAGGLIPSDSLPSGFTFTGISPDGINSEDENLSEEIGELSRLLTLSEEDFEQEVFSISDEEADQMNLLYDNYREELFGSTQNKGTAVVQRDWSKYTSSTAKKKLTYNESVFYDRLDAACREHLENPTGGFLIRKDWYSTIKGVKFGDLNIPKEKLRSLISWFKYNNPQYYFLKGGYAASNDTLFVCINNFALELEDFGKTTNEIFNKLDSWIAECSDDEVTTYQKLLSANKKICLSIKYDPVIKYKDKHTQAEKDKAYDTNQSIYSVLKLPVTVCAGYALTMTAMSNAMGIDAITALSETHAWNTIKFDDNKYYFVDVCWNDFDKGYNTDWIGVGTTQANSNPKSKSHIYEIDTAQLWAPEVEKNNYKVTAQDTGASVKTLAKPAPKVVGSGEAGIKLSWNKVANADKYEIKASCNGNEIMYIASTDTQKYIPYVNGAKSIKVLVRARCTDNGNTVYSDWAEITATDKDSKKLAAPTNVKIAKQDAGLKLKWDSSKDSTFFVNYGTDSTMSKVANSCLLNANNAVWKQWNHEKLNYFSIAAVEKSGDTETISAPVLFSYSKSSGIKLLNSTSGNSTTNNTIAAPTNIKLKVRPSTDGRRALQCDWDAVSGADKYEFELGNSDFSTVAGRATRKPDQTTISYVVSDKSEHIYVRVRAVKGSGNNAVYSKWTNADIVTPDNTTATPEKPSAPKKVSRKADANNETFTWDKVQGADGYTITLYTDATRKKVWCEFNRTDTSIYLGPFTDGKTYYGGVRSVVTKNGKSTYSDYTNFEFKHNSTEDKPAAPKKLSQTANADSEKFTWDKVDGATGYTLTLFKNSDKKDVWCEFNTTDTAINLSPFTDGKAYCGGIRSYVSKNGKITYSDYSYLDFTHKSTASTEKLSAPKNVKRTTNADSEIFSWDKVQGAEGYTVTFFKDASKKEAWVEFGTTETSLTIYQLYNGCNYYAGIRAYVTKNGQKTYSDYAHIDFTHKKSAAA